MNEKINLIMESVPNQEKATELMNRIFDAARPEAVYSEPVTSGDYTVITASEISVGLGFGYGGGGGAGPVPTEGEEEETGTSKEGIGFGSGGGGGGGSSARPVAAIIVDPNGVRVEPIVDATKIIVAFFTTFGAMMMTMGKLRLGGMKRLGKVD